VLSSPSMTETASVDQTFVHGRCWAACGHVSRRPTRCGLADRHIAPAAGRPRI